MDAPPSAASEHLRVSISDIGSGSERPRCYRFAAVAYNPSPRMTSFDDSQLGLTAAKIVRHLVYILRWTLGTGYFSANLRSK